MPLISLSSAKLTEGPAGVLGEMRFVVTLSAPAAQDVTLSYATAPSAKNPATAGLDFVDASGTLTIPLGQREGYIDVAIVGDALREGDESLDLVLSNASGASFAKGATVSGTGTIVDGAPVISIAAAKLKEGPYGHEGKMRFVVKLSAPAAQDVTVDYAPVAGSKTPALEGVDYTDARGTLTIPLGQTEGYIDVTVLGDILSEGDETFDLVLTNPYGAGFSKAGVASVSATGTIADASAAALSMAAAKLTEEAVGATGKMRFVVKLSAPAAQAVTVDYAPTAGAKAPATEGVDFASARGTLTIPVGQVEGYIDVDILGDADAEGDETFNLVLSNAVGATLGKAGAATVSATGTIVDDETAKGQDAKLKAESAKLREGAETGPADSSSSQMRFTVSLTAPVNQEVSVQYKTVSSKGPTAAKAGADFGNASGTLVFAKGETVKYVYVDIVDDRLKEADESFELHLSAPRGAGFEAGKTLVATGIISDNEGNISIEPKAQFREGASTPDEASGSQMRFAVSLDTPAARSVSVHYKTVSLKGADAAKAGLDYVAASGTLTFTRGETLKYIYVDILDDNVKETDEIFGLELSKPAGAAFGSGTTLLSTGTIADNEGFVSAAGASLYEGTPTPGGHDRSQMRFAVTLSAPAADEVTVQYKTANGKGATAAKAGADYLADQGEVFFAPGETLQYVYIDILDDSQKESDETFDLILYDPQGAAFAAGKQIAVVGTILENEPNIIA